MTRSCSETNCTFVESDQRSRASCVRIVSFDLDVIKISCILGQDSPTLKFIGQLLLWPMGLGVFLTCWLISQLRGDKMSLDTVFQLGGVLVFALFISITLAVLDPFLCIQNPDGSSSMASSPGVVCFNSEEHVWLAFLSSLGILCYPLLVLSWATFTTLWLVRFVKSYVFCFFERNESVHDLK